MQPGRNHPHRPAMTHNDSLMRFAGCWCSLTTEPQSASTDPGHSGSTITVIGTGRSIRRASRSSVRLTNCGCHAPPVPIRIAVAAGGIIYGRCRSVSSSSSPYLNFTSSLRACPQRSHSNVRQSWSGLSVGSMRASIMRAPHLAQAGRYTSTWFTGKGDAGCTVLPSLRRERDRSLCHRQPAGDDR